MGYRHLADELPRIGTQRGAYGAARKFWTTARAAGIRKLTGTYRPTDRNKLVVDHYARLGFTLVGKKNPD